MELLLSFSHFAFSKSSQEFIANIEKVSSLYLKSGLLYISIADNMADILFSTNLWHLDFITKTPFSVFAMILNNKIIN